MKKVVAALGFTAVFVLGMVQFATEAMADRPPIISCSTTFCVPCPEGYVLTPTPGNCCRCVKAR
jgi:hypothetical protein